MMDTLYFVGFLVTVSLFVASLLTVCDLAGGAWFILVLIFEMFAIGFFAERLVSLPEKGLEMEAAPITAEVSIGPDGVRLTTDY